MANTRRLTVADLAERYDVTKRTIYEWNYHGTGPKRIRVGKYVRYRECDVDQWERAHEKPGAL